MATQLHVEIVTPLSSAFSGKALQVILPAWEGQEGVLPDHDDKLTLLRGGVCTVITPEGERKFAIGRGFAEMGGDHVTLLTDSCEDASKIDKADAQAGYADIEAKLARADWVSEEANGLRAALEVAQARLDA